MRLSNWVPSWRSLLRVLIPLGLYPAIWVGIGAAVVRIVVSVDGDQISSSKPLVALSILLIPVWILVPVVVLAYLHHWIVVSESPWLRPGARSLWEGLYALQVLVCSSIVAALPVIYGAIMLGMVTGFENMDTFFENQYEAGVGEFVLLYVVAAYFYHLESLSRKPKLTKEPSKKAKQSDVDGELEDMKKLVGKSQRAFKKK